MAGRGPIKSLEQRTEEGSIQEKIIVQRAQTEVKRIVDLVFFFLFFFVL